jgi:hypothetical protein
VEKKIAYSLVCPTSPTIAPDFFGVDSVKPNLDVVKSVLGIPLKHTYSIES